MKSHQRKEGEASFSMCKSPETRSLVVHLRNGKMASVARVMSWKRGIGEGPQSKKGRVDIT